MLCSSKTEVVTLDSAVPTRGVPVVEWVEHLLSVLTQTMKSLFRRAHGASDKSLAELVRGAGCWVLCGAGCCVLGAVWCVLRSTAGCGMLCIAPGAMRAAAVCCACCCIAPGAVRAAGGCWVLCLVLLGAVRRAG